MDTDTANDESKKVSPTKTGTQAPKAPRRRAAPKPKSSPGPVAKRQSSQASNSSSAKPEPVAFPRRRVWPD